MSSSAPKPEPREPESGDRRGAASGSSRMLLAGLWNRIRDFFIALPKITLAQAARFTVIVGLAAVLFGGIGIALFTLPGSVPAELPVSDIRYLDSQGWGANRESQPRQSFYYTAQGANVKRVRYRWFVKLEKAWSTERLADPENMRGYRFLVDAAATPNNPDRLPVGFARYFNPNVNEDVLDITCAACHTGELHVNAGGQRVALRIDGGQAMHAFTSPDRGQFLSDLNASLMTTYFNPLKFTRFAKKVLGNRYPSGYFHLHGELRKVWWAVFSQGIGDNYIHRLYPTEEGFGRTDAVQRISNNVFGDHIDSKNLRVGDGPVSYPPLWNIWKFDWVQYIAEARQPLARNLGETLGVGADYQLVQEDGSPVAEENRFATTTAVNNLIVLEDALKTLRPPKWPEEILGAIDCDRARKGQEYFKVMCAHCHGPNAMEGLEKEFKWWMAPLKTKNDPLWAISVVPLAAIGTDPNAAMDFVNYKYDLTKTGITGPEIRQVMLPERAWDEERRIEFLQAQVKQLSQSSNLDCWKTNDLQSATAALAAANPGPCMTALRKMDGVPRPAQCQGGPLAALNGFDCAEAIRQYDKVIWDIAVEASHVCPNISRALDSIDVKSVTTGAGLNYVGMLMSRKYFRDSGILSDAEAQMSGFGTLDLPQVVLGYKPRPLAGIWATPPFLHNGSVPTLYELLSPVEKRSKRFVMGERMFDPVNVGYLTQPQTQGAWWFDTSVSGNSNHGHEFRDGYVPPCSLDANGVAKVTYQNGVIGPELTDDIRYSIIEYLKIKDDDDPDHELPVRCSKDAAPERK